MHAIYMFTATYFVVFCCCFFSVYVLRVLFAWPRCCNRMFGQRWRHWIKMRHFSVNVHIFPFLKTLAKFCLFWLWNHLHALSTLCWRERNFVSDRLPGFLIPLHNQPFHLYRQSWALFFSLGSYILEAVGLMWNSKIPVMEGWLMGIGFFEMQNENL